MTMKSAIARSLAFACLLWLAASPADAQWPFGRQNNNEQSDLTVRIQELERKVRELTGQNEELQHQNQILQQQLSASAGGAMARPQGGAPAPSGPMAGPGMTQGSMIDPPLAAPPYGGGPQAQPPYGAPQAQPSYGQPQYGTPPASEAAVHSGGAPKGDAFDPAAHPNAPGAPRPLGAPLDMSAMRGGQAPGAPMEGPPPINDRSGQQQMAVLPPSNSPKDEYDLAYGYILRRDYALADQAFRVFLQAHPDDRLVPDATYWLGESLYQRQQFNDAAQTFLDVYNKYPKSAKAPEALLRLGQSLAATGQQEAACASIGAVLKKYPKASPQVKNQVTAEQKRVGC
jgi:tol-pal system protein YbgF